MALPEPEVVVDLEVPVRAVLALVDPGVLARLLLLVFLPQRVVPPQLVAVVAEPQVEEVSVEAPHPRRSLSAAMAGNSPPAGTPPYSPVPRSGRKAKRRP